MLTPRRAIPLQAALCGSLTAALALAGCGQAEERSDPAAPEAPASSAAERGSEETHMSAEEVSTTRGDHRSGASADVPESVAKVKQKFSALVPEKVFAELESCDPVGNKDDHFSCSGPEVGQFQFMSNQNSAATTTQQLTQLRSSRVVEDSGDRIVGWSTLGTTAVISVVDNKAGLVMQQMVQSNVTDPEQRIYDLGLAERKASSATSPSSAAPGDTASKSK